MGLNATWLQLGSGDYERELHVDVRQLLKVTGNRPDEWVTSNAANLLITHQPASWLHPNRPSTWENDINPPGRFDVHLFGHMHQPDVSSVKHGGGFGRVDVQAASLFGLERYGDGLERIQGYSLSEIDVSSNNRILTSWPRRLITTTSGRCKLDRDTEQDLDEATGSFTIPYEVEVKCQVSVSATAAPQTMPPAIPQMELSPQTSFGLSAIRFATGDVRAHRKVRRVEQETCLHAFSSKRVIWLAADWGMGTEGFIGSILDKLGVPEDHIFSLDFSAFRKRDAFYDALQTRLNATFPQICEAISEIGPSILILNDVDLSAELHQPGLEREIEILAETVADFADEAFVVIGSRRHPRNARYPVVELKPLDEADVAIYAVESEIGDFHYGKPDAASKLFRHTDGVPTRIDDALRDLEIISLRDLITANPDFGETGGVTSGAPQALVDSVLELKRSKDRSEQRAYELLLALAALPQGEQLTRLKRFLGVHPFGPMHARALLERSLIQTVGLPTLDASADSADKALVVPRPVRDHVRETMDPEIAWATDRKALDLYFGEDWTSGSILNSPTGKRIRTAFCDGYEMQNASTLILRCARRSLDTGEQVEIQATIRLALSFIEGLITGHHFRAAAGLCEDVLQLLGDYGGYVKEQAKFNYEYGRSLRMIGRVKEARDVLQALDEVHLSKTQKQQAALNLALCFESLGDEAAAAETAERTIAIDRHTTPALQAKVIIAEQIQDEDAREAALRKYLRTAESKKAHVLANNIRLEIARGGNKNSNSNLKILQDMSKQAKIDGDYYNSVRAIVTLAEFPGSELIMSAEEKTRLVEAYHFLYNERLFGLFDRCHDALWRVFEHAGNRANLLHLFRRSSFIWRLNGREDVEAKYLAKLMKIVHDLISLGLTQANRDGVYLVVRITVVTGTAISDLAKKKLGPQDK
ncbi:tetratricopeptide repeat protein [Komagataeibacter swingsii]|uniref:Calcineurin-like phosphoesterase domain-containing protein n=1 Tax=Komagataeibacter swingsii TaxID=215220 RepID=A0A850P201_9PROT|nr:hypothetical protein [Komagataeibacter swingsii]NVN38705.1 hypothetical protein [Komagataeibacter swingsii]